MRTQFAVAIDRNISRLEKELAEARADYATTVAEFTGGKFPESVWKRCHRLESSLAAARRMREALEEIT